ncbi:hypothetical protein SUGI_0919730 [Cryptomeria japonica]|nr:hypothetical protein SUGI_0919730 [Cryptomeria japonica]
MGVIKDLSYKVARNEKGLLTGKTTTCFTEGQGLHNKPYDTHRPKKPPQNDREMIYKQQNSMKPIRDTPDPFRREHVNYQDDLLGCDTCYLPQALVKCIVAIVMMREKEFPTKDGGPKYYDDNEIGQLDT